MRKQEIVRIVYSLQKSVQNKHATHRSLEITSGKAKKTYSSKRDYTFRSALGRLGFENPLPSAERRVDGSKG